MATPTNYLVSFNPAEKTAHGFKTTISTLPSGTKHGVTAASLPDLERQVRALAHDFGQSCCPYVRLAERGARKPSGFDRWANSLQFIEYVPEPVIQHAA